MKVYIQFKLFQVFFFFINLLKSCFTRKNSYDVIIIHQKQSCDFGLYNNIEQIKIYKQIQIDKYCTHNFA